MRKINNSYVMALLLASAFNGHAMDDPRGPSFGVAATAGAVVKPAVVGEMPQGDVPEVRKLNSAERLLKADDDIELLLKVQDRESQEAIDVVQGQIAALQAEIVSTQEKRAILVAGLVEKMGGDYLNYLEYDKKEYAIHFSLEECKKRAKARFERQFPQSKEQLRAIYMKVLEYDARLKYFPAQIELKQKQILDIQRDNREDPKNVRAVLDMAGQPEKRG